MRLPIRTLFAASVLASAPVLSASQPATEATDITTTTCAQLAQESEENRAFALIFYYGYLAGRSNATTIDNALVAGHLLKVREHCTANPESTVIDAFVAALK
jgi:hypothetical protein